MERRRLGSLSVSIVGLGCNNFGTRIDASATAEVVGAALDAGIDSEPVNLSSGSDRLIPSGAVPE